MELDKDTLEMIIETNATCKHILSQLERGEKRFEKIDTQLKEYNGQIRKVEQQQSFLNGKLAMVIVGIGSIVTIIFNAAIWAWLKIAGD
jgi:septal ring factor EnvC (AmiA/AmiB activator)